MKINLFPRVVFSDVLAKNLDSFSHNLALGSWLGFPAIRKNRFAKFSHLACEM